MYFIKVEKPANTFNRCAASADEPSHPATYHRIYYLKNYQWLLCAPEYVIILVSKMHIMF